MKLNGCHKNCMYFSIFKNAILEAKMLFLKMSIQINFFMTCLKMQVIFFSNQNFFYIVRNLPNNITRDITEMKILWAISEQAIII